MSGPHNLGERFLPDSMKGVIALEHLHRYCFALQFVRGRDVLDLASGEGYGSAMLAARGKRVVGVDIDGSAVEQASARYPGADLAFKHGSCAAIPLPDQSIDVVVSFETIEHHDQHAEMLAEIKRVLRGSGLLVISSPDKLEYSDRPGFHNPFHVHELYAEEFEQLLKSHFKHVRLLRQRVLAGSWLLQDDTNAQLEYFEASELSDPVARLARAPYLVAVASDADLPAISGGVLEEDVLQLAAPVLRDANRRATTLIRALALPDSQLLRQSLDADWYLRTNVDLAGEDVDRYAHWISNGADEGRLPADDLAALARGLLAEHVSGAGHVRADVAAAHASGLLTRQDALSLQMLAEREERFRAQLQAFQDRLANEGSTAAAREADLQAKLAASSERERGLQQMLEIELARTAQERSREAAARQQLEDGTAQVRADLKALLERRDADMRSVQDAAAQRDKAAEQRHAELLALLAAATAREHAASAQHVQLLQDAEREKLSLQGKVTEAELGCRQQVVELEASFRQQVLALESGFRQQILASEAAFREQVAAMGASFREQAATMEASFRKQEADREAMHRQEALKLADRLVACERDCAAQLTQLRAAAAVQELAAVQANSAHARQEAALRSDLARAREEFQAAAAAARQLADRASAERQALVEDHAATTQQLLNKLARIEASASWRWTAPLRAFRGGAAQAADTGAPGRTPLPSAESKTGDDRAER